eukprot:Hpha_TRINITY_DN15498_c2_g4::TRINITY_DN15498_c2_g4_i3::g.173085::m.173085
MRATGLLLLAAGCTAQQQFVVEPRASAPAPTAWPTQDPHNFDTFNKLFGSATLAVPQLPKIPLNNISVAALGTTITITDSWILAHNVVCGDIQIGDLSVPEEDGEDKVDFAIVLAGLRLTCTANVEALLNVPPLLSHEHVWGQDLTINLTVGAEIGFHFPRESSVTPITNASLVGCNFSVGLGLACVEDAKNHSASGICELITNLGPVITPMVSKLVDGPEGAVCKELDKLAVKALPSIPKLAKSAFDIFDVPPQPIPSVADAEKELTDYASAQGKHLLKIGSGVLPALGKLLNKTLGKPVGGDRVGLDSLYDGIFHGKAVTVPVPDVSFSLWNVKMLDEVLRMNVSLKSVTIGGLDTFSSFDIFELLSAYTITSKFQMKTLRVNATFEVLAAPGALVHGAPSLVRDELTISFAIENLGAVLQTVVGIDADALRKVSLYGLKKDALGCLLSVLITDPERLAVPGVEFNELELDLSGLRLTLNGNLSTGLDNALYGLGKAFRVLILHPLIPSLPKILQDTVRPFLNPLIAKALVSAQQKHGACPTRPAFKPPSMQEIEKDIVDFFEKL